ncbi:MAG: PP2C family protein-serine/threonine phosphatase [Planctomycetaceae bacterium]
MTDMFGLFDAEHGTWRDRLRFIVETMREVSLQTNPETMVSAYSRRMQATMKARMISLSRRGLAPPRVLVARDTLWETQPSPWRDRASLPVLHGGVLSELIYGNEARIDNAFRCPPGDPAERMLEGYGALAAIPVFDGGEALNLVLFLRHPGERFDESTFPQLVWTTNLFGRATHNLVLSGQLRKALADLDREMKLIADIQRSLLPRELPRIAALDLAAHYRPAAVAGGDYYDFLALAGGRLGILIADVSGHGSPAAVEMAITRTLAHSHPRTVDAPGPLLAYVNDHLADRYRRGTGTFVTAFYGVFDPGKGEVRYARAGHPPPRLKRCSDGTLLSFDDARGLPLGVQQGARYEEAILRVLPGDQIVFYTDGITEALNPDNEQFGPARLDETLENCTLEASGLVDTVLGAVDAFSSGREPIDDRTLLVARVRPAASPFSAREAGRRQDDERQTMQGPMEHGAASITGDVGSARIPRRRRLPKRGGRASLAEALRAPRELPASRLRPS